jgi:hypothetical protein
MITAEEANKLAAYSDKYWKESRVEFVSWREVPAEPQQKLIDEVIRRLDEEGIPPPEIDVMEKAIRWRMTQVIKSKKAKSARK